MTAALDSAGPGIGGPLLHLAILIAAYAASPGSRCADSAPFRHTFPSRRD